MKENERVDGPQKRQRSSSSYSSTTVSTISTTLSRSPLHPVEDVQIPRKTKESKYPGPGKRRRSSSCSSTSYTSDSSVAKRRRNRSQGDSRNTRRKWSSISPDSRGRRRNHREKSVDSRSHYDRKHRRGSSSSSSSYTSDSSYGRRNRDHSFETYHKSKRSRSSVSRDSGVRTKAFNGKRSNRQTRSRSFSRDRSKVARNRHSMTPVSHPHHRPNSTEARSAQERQRRYSNDNDRYGSSLRDLDRRISGPGTSRQPYQHTRKERSLSPFSKRLALTQAMNMSH